MIDYEDMIADLQRRLEKEESVKNIVLLKEAIRVLSDLRERQ